ncbi:hypothetical protein [Palleronia sp. LCG004]|uniref:hypothetical protein n=1 Tax=Palleronia sp. LCG004 TaxID=3079304 RepID=UPI00294311F2|nr:hypothetical protein [Palleronia sp. LCG004]WOI55266.1 hypothetical protein RVY76_09410 [Palleronia sp. LCG004]
MSDRAKPHVPPKTAMWQLIAGPIIWSVHFVLTYGGTAIFCAKLEMGPLALPLRGYVAGVTIAALVAIAITGWLAWVKWDLTDDWDYIHEEPTDEERTEFLGHAGVLLCVVSAIGVIFVGLPALLITGCI